MYSLGIDTSNYKTSVALVDEDSNILVNIQQFLDVKKGERGLRQSDAFFQHNTRLPELVNSVLVNEEYRKNISCVSVSTRPRPVEGSYMPCFLAGEGYAKVIAQSLNVPCFSFSHQEGHIEAIRHFTELKDKKGFITFHFSGGTTEAILVDNKYEIVAKTKDISFGQVLDRVGVAIGYDFPCGQEIDRLARECEIVKPVFTSIKVENGDINLSGIETQAQKAVGRYDEKEIACSLMLEICKAIAKIVEYLAKEYKINDYIFSGGVSSSIFLRNYITNKFPEYNIIFGNPKLSTDNAVGIALLGGKSIWR